MKHNAMNFCISTDKYNLYNIGSVTEQPKNIKRVTYDPREWRNFFLFFSARRQTEVGKKFRVDILNNMPEKNDPRWAANDRVQAFLRLRGDAEIAERYK